MTRAWTRRVKLFVLFLLILGLLSSCEHNVYIDDEDAMNTDIWRVGSGEDSLYFETANEAIEYIMGQPSARSLSRTEDAGRTITLMRPVLASGSDGIVDSSYEKYVADDSFRGSIEVPAAFEGDLCIDFNGYRYDFSNGNESFFIIEGGDNVYIYNGQSVIFNEASHVPYAIVVDTKTVTIDVHLLDDRRTDGGSSSDASGSSTGSSSGGSSSDSPNNLIYVGEKGHLKLQNIKSGDGDGDGDGTSSGDTSSGGTTSGASSKKTLSGKVSVVTDGEVGAFLEIENSKISIANIYTMYKGEDGTLNDTIETAIPEGAKSRIDIISGEVDILAINRETDYYNPGTGSGTEIFFDKAILNVMGTREDTTIRNPHEIDATVKEVIENSEGEARHAIIHSLDHIPALKETCTQDGHIQYWHCTVCGNYYEDEDATIEIDDLSTTIIPHHELSDWVYDIDNHWKVCSVEGKVFVAAHTWGDYQEHISGTVTHFVAECEVCTAKKAASQQDLIYDIGIGEASLKALEATPCGDFYVNGSIVDYNETIHVAQPNVVAQFKPYLGSNANYTPSSFVLHRGDIEELSTGQKTSDGYYSVSATLADNKEYALNIQLEAEGGSLGWCCYIYLGD